MASTTCPHHRREGCAYIDGVLACRVCKLPHAAHETNAETVARRAKADEALAKLREATGAPLPDWARSSRITVIPNGVDPEVWAFSQGLV